MALPSRVSMQYDHLGCSVSTAGDINGDGFADLVLGASGASPGGRTGGYGVCAVWEE